MNLDCLHFMAGLPRSGSTLLANLISQHPDAYVSATSGLLSAVLGVKMNWQSNTNFQAEGLERVLPRIRSLLRGILYGYYQAEFSTGRTVIDRNRAWTDDLAALENILGRPARIIFPVREVKAVVASFERIHRSGALLTNDLHQIKLRAERVEHWLAPEGVIGGPVQLLRAAMEQGFDDRLLFVPYNLLVSDTANVLPGVARWLGLARFEFDTTRVVQTIEQNDTVHGFAPGALHHISDVITPSDVDPKALLGQMTCDRLDRAYADIDRLCHPQVKNIQQ
jgi:sulfotransferase